MSWKVTTRVWETSPQKGGALLVLLAIADYANEQGEAWPSIPTVAKRARMSERQVYKLISHLLFAGELEVSSRPGHTNVYKVVCADLELVATPVKSSGVDGHAPLNPRTGYPCRPGQGTPEPQDRGPLNPRTGKLLLNGQGTVNERSARARPIRKRVKNIDDLTTNDYFRWLIYEHAPHVDLELALREFVNYCESKGEIFKDYAAAFENSVLRQEAWWLKDNPDAGAPDTLMYGDFKPDNSPARRAYRAAYIAWKDEGEHGEPPSVQSFYHLNQRGPDV